MTYYAQHEDGSIGAHTTDREAAIAHNLTLTDEREIVVGYDMKYYFKGTEPERPVTVADYDNAMEAHLEAEKTARGYTKREPSDYANSSESRWKQDAADWIAHRDEVMRYGLDIQNKHAAGEKVPTLEEFKASLPTITWTFESA